MLMGLSPAIKGDLPSPDAIPDAADAPKT
jgi:hypothetical protein